METPDERDITKQQLWERIDTVLETIGTVGRNTADNVSAVLPTIQRNNEMALAEFKTYLKKTMEDLQSYVDGKIKFIEKLNNDGFGKMVNESQRLKQDVDKRFQDMRKNLDDDMSHQIQDAFAQITQNLQQYVDKVSEYKKNSDMQISSVQKETGLKLGEMKNLFEDFKKKFKTITEQLQ